MIIRGGNGQTFELKVLGYQYLNATHIMDASWLSIYFEYKSEQDQWDYTDPSLGDGEVHAIVNWFKHLSDNSKPEYKELTFLDTNLKFELLNEVTASVKKIRLSKGEKFFMDFEYDNYELKELSAGLSEELSKLPPNYVIDEDNWDSDSE